MQNRPSFIRRLSAGCALFSGYVAATAAPQIIIKADDVGIGGPVVEQKWQRFVDYIEANQLKATIGIVTDSLENPNAAYIEWILEQHHSGRIEFFHHGYDHSRDATTWEFRNRDYKTQKFHFDRGMELAEEKLGIKLRTFGAPYNQTDIVTERVLEEHPDMRIWLYPPGFVVDSPLTLLRRIGPMNIEQTTGTVVYAPVAENYPDYADEEVLVLQCHPSAWNESSWSEFSRIVDFLKQQGATFTTPTAHTQTWRSELYPETWTAPEASISFENDAFIQDFSYAGFRRGEEPIPQVSGPIFNVVDYGADPAGSSDSTAAIQSAISAAQAAGGGVVYLPAGEFRVSPGPLGYCLIIDSSNIVLRGAGTDQTFILNTSYEMRGKTVIRVGPSAASIGAGVAITEDILGPSRRIFVADSSGFAVGDFVRIEWVFTADWIAEHRQEAYWSESARPAKARYYREVIATNAAEGWIEVDVPMRYFIKVRDMPRVYKLGGLRGDVGSVLHHIGLESFSIGNVQHPGNGWGMDDYGDPTKAAYDAHVSFLISMNYTRDSWIKSVHSRQAQENTTTAHMLSNGIVINDSFRVTVSECSMSRPQFGGGGGNGYMYRLTYANDCLVEKSVAEFSRHGLVVTSAGTSGNVFHQCTDRETGRAVGSSPTGHATSGSGSDNHMHFSHSNLWDRCHAHNSFYTASHRQRSGSIPHGLSSAHAVYWNTTGSGTRYPDIVRSEQARYGYVIGTSGSASGAVNPVLGNTAPADILEGIGMGHTLQPQSLYLDQLSRRLSISVIYDGNFASSGQVPLDSSNPYEAGEIAAVAGPGNLEKLYHRFTGWNTQRDGSGTSYSEQDTLEIVARTILYAQWERHRRTVTFDPNNSSSSDLLFKVVEVGLSYGVLPEVSLPAYSQTGWFTAPVGGEIVTAETLVARDEDHTLYAQWNALPEVDAGLDQSLALYAEAQPWTPVRIATRAWYDAADRGSMGMSDNRVLQWMDKSGEGNHLTQLQAANRPSIDVASMGGFGLVSFRANESQFLTAPNHASLQFDSNEGMNIFAVFQSSGYSNQASGVNVLLGKGELLGASPAYGFGISNSNELTFKAAGDLVYSISRPLNQGILFSGLRSDDSGLVFVYLDGKFVGREIRRGELVSDNGNPLQIGRGPSEGSYADVDFGEILMAGDDLTPVEQQQIEGYLAHKWGLNGNLDSGHPFKDNPPTFSGQARLKGTVSDPDNDLLSYRWQLVSGPAPVQFDDASSLEPVVTFSQQGIYLFSLTAEDGYGSASDDVMVSIHDQLLPLGFVQWSGSGDFHGDTNADGVPDGMAWLLGVATAGEKIDSLLLPGKLMGGEVVISFSMLNQNARGNTLLELQYSKDLNQWNTVGIPENSGRIEGIDFEITPRGAVNEVKVSFPDDPFPDGENSYFRLTGRLLR